jgi:hypothetical protein
VRGERRNQHDVSSDSCRMLRDAETGKRSRSQQRAGGRKGVFQTQGTAQCGDGTEDASSTGDLAAPHCSVPTALEEGDDSGEAKLSPTASLSWPWPCPWEEGREHQTLKGVG